jgi:hypothetical protein
MTPPEAYKRYRYRFCGHVINAWLPAAKRPNDAKLLYHLSQQHPDEVKPSLERMRTEDSGDGASGDVWGCEGVGRLSRDRCDPRVCRPTWGPPPLETRAILGECGEAPG